jgi:hypothetical protein
MNPVFIIAMVAVSAVIVIAAYRGKGQIGAGSRWGLNLKRNQKCPSCTAAVPGVRMPKNLRQALWGGFTCSCCRVEYDKWLNPIRNEK